MAQPKDHLTEEQALARAKDEGIEFVDEYHVLDEIGGQPISIHKTQKEADKAAKGKQFVAQVRHQKPQES